MKCCFTGHRSIPEKDKLNIMIKLERAVKSLVAEGCTVFCAGGALGFDTLAAECVLEVRSKYPQVHLHVIMPCRNQTKGWNSENIRSFERINSFADEVKCLSEDYYNGCMQSRNRYMVDNSSVIIAYLTKNNGGSAYTVKYAEKQGLRIINIATDIL